MLFSLEVLPAAAGDCLILHWGDGRTAVIDGGPARTFEDMLQPRLLKIKENRKLDQLVLDLVMVSHIDNDHIVGVKKLFSALQAEVVRQDTETMRPLRVERLWHNTFADILGQPTLQKATSEAKILPAGPFAEPAFGRGTETDLSLILAGHNEGRSLRDAHQMLLREHRIGRLNTPFEPGSDGLITDESTPSPAHVEGLQFTFIGPQRPDITKLKATFDKFMVDSGLTAEHALAALPKDVSPANLSSLVCLVEFQGKTILLTGDARGDKILDGLKAKRLIKERLDIDILKVQHHGSFRNTSLEFFKAIRASHYVISADGQNGNPDRETISCLLDSRAPEDVYKIHFTYPVEQIDRTRQSRRREAWSDDSDAIQCLLEAKKRAGYKFEVVEGRSVLNLGDDVVAW